MQLFDFATRGLGEQIRIALAFADAEYEDVPVNFSEMKTDVDTYPFGQCPRLQDGEVSIVHSQVILRYIARKYDLYGDSEQAQLAIDTVLEGVAALRRFYFQLAYTHNMDEGRIADHWTAHGDPATRDQRNGGAHWAYLSRLLNNNSASGEGPVVGASKTIADTTLFEVSHIYLQLYPEEMRAAYPSIVKHHDMMANVTGIHAYLARGERRDEFTTSFALKDDSPLPTSVSMPSPVSAEA